ncbi:sulfotransferase-like domain-containing protein [Neolewinella antarctica]|uniref:Sulfotransferase family protein n=1 Tax=Neolewinella antarctica TaxID=442734 RepID=A0ABX0XBA4_9BACT|nr:hypothetical protein [Neolewinella antarctica]NJC26345.1 hypothetical protein [Neolewinella antarctica]
MTKTRINLWSSPRNISTALMYGLAQNPAVAVVDEPLYAHYLRHQPTEAEHPGREEILAHMEDDGIQVVRSMLTGDYGRPNVVFKQMTHHLVALDPAFLNHMQNVLLIRDPREILRSFGEVVEKVTAEDIGVLQQFALFKSLRKTGKLAAVIDARLLLLNPRRVVRQLCERLGFEFTESMLSWTAGPRPEDGVWAKHWYAGVHKSTGFLPYRERAFTLSPELQRIADQCQPAYEEMLASSLF